MKRLLKWLLNLFSRSSPEGLENIIQIRRVENIPLRLYSNFLYLEGEGDEFWTAALLCPCGCNEQIQLNLVSDCNPFWKVTDYEKVTINPSIWRKKGCQSHFLIYKGKISWHTKQSNYKLNYLTSLL